MKNRTLRYSLYSSLLLGGVAGAASAQSSTKSAGAEALYEEARSLMKHNDFEHACPKFKQSYDLDPGGGTLLNLAECYEKQGKFASAWSTFKEALVVAQRDGRSERVDYAKKHLAVVEPKVSKITIEVTSEANEPGLTVTLDGAPLGAAAWGVGMPVDPGPHQVAASAPNKTTFERSVQIESGSSTLKILKLDDAPVAAAPPRAIDQDVEKRPVPGEPAIAGNGSRTVGFVLLGAGVVGIGVGSYFGLHAFSKWSERKDGCTNGCTPDAKKAGDSASSSALISDIGFGVGLIAAGVGTYLVLSAKPASEAGGANTQHEARRTLSLLPVANANGGGLWLRGSY